MHYLIDGHNLIGRMPDIHLDDPDDEVRLVQRLRSWASRSRKRRVTVIFDKGLPGGQDKGLSSGKIKVLFAPQGMSADTMLLRRIQAVKNPREYTLVTSDRRILQAAEKRNMPSWQSEVFVNTLMGDSEPNKPNGETADKSEKPDLDPADVELWLRIFGSDLDDGSGQKS